MVVWYPICSADEPEENAIPDKERGYTTPHDSLYLPKSTLHVGCVRNGLMLPAANQQYLHLSFGMEKMIIGSLTGMTGCNNFINMNAL